ncbi:MAG: CPBP family intramembrane metalloprotease [Actinobacteria bacterium]|nr:CPBP family intramembrane metalloprotease [Actinomycetota bacterium]
MNPATEEHTGGYRESAPRRRRVVVSVITLAAGAVALAWTTRIEPGDRMFYVAGAVLAGIWAAGALLSGPLRLGRVPGRPGDSRARAVAQAVALGSALLAVFLLGGLIVSRLAVLREPVAHLLAHGRTADSLALVLTVAAVNGIAEELYFRGALYAALPARHAVVGTTLIYTAVTAASGIVLLAFAALVLGAVTGLQRHRTGGILGPIVTHLIWSGGMVLLLPPILGTS